MAKLAYGVPDKHILKSQGADNDLMKFYCTQNATTYGAKWAKFEPRMGRPVGSGYVSNVRPTISYCARLDEVDNPTMGRIVGDNYHTITERSFGRYVGADGTEALPNSVYQAGSGFVRGKQCHIPTQQEVQAYCIGAKVAASPCVDILPRHKPHLHKIQPKDTVELENGGYGPGCMTTETSERFKARSSHVDSSQKTIGNIEDTGFTHNHNVEPLTYHADYAFTGDVPGFMTPRPTGVSITMTDYRPSVGGSGLEPLPKITNRASRDSGFTVGTKVNTDFLPSSLKDTYDRLDDQAPSKVDRVRKQDPMEYVNLTHPNNHSSVAQNTWLGKQRREPTEADRLGSLSVGLKESTGYTVNNTRHVWSADNPGRFITDYQMRFLDRTPKGADREGHVWGGVLPAKEDGYTKNTHTNSYGLEYNSTNTLRNLEPYVARSIKAKDTFFDDHTYDSKLRTETMAA